jgi:guanine nucleotide-binding protein alpha-1 subunit
MFSADPNDPLTLALAPPLDETRKQRAERKSREHKARVISNKIDEDIKKERLALKKPKNLIRVLLLSQSESGKSRSLPAYHLTLIY